jgi:hypothetical protein
MDTKPKKKIPEIHVYNSPDRKRESQQIVELSRKLYYRFLETNNIISARPCYNWVKLGPSKYNKVDGKFRNFLDHSTLLVSENDKMLVSQPYNFNINEVEGWASKRGLSVEVDENNSWYYPSRTTLLIFRIKDKDFFEAYIENNARNSNLGNGMREVE